MFDDSVFQQAFDESEKMSHDPTQREAYQRRLRNLREERARLSSAIRQGRAIEVPDKIRLMERMLKFIVTPSEALESMPLPQL